ncbi:hypothetical protein K445DRAFT_278072 [Daldinia sp. EC12]|nr:hypothetical protein F4774DRAFT_132060 [Daldinia eschscholtzii]OTB17491.1 hypothetical protein K445DRAFT_278072 [Daldinia sp. EC12]
MTYNDIDIPLPAFIAIDWTGMTIALVPIILRFWLRSRESQPRTATLNLSDGLVLLSWISGIVLISINTWKNNLRQHYIHLPHDELYYGVPWDLSAHLLYVSWISLFFIYISLWAAKFSLLAFFADLLHLTENRAARIMLICASVFTGCTFILHMVLLSAWCSPVSGNWNINEHLCSAVHDIRSVSISTASNIFTDLIILTIPLFALYTMGQERREITKTRIGKAEISGIVFVLCMAALSIVAALARWITLMLVRNAPKADITHTIDVWALVEIVASLVAVCLPSLRSFLRKRRRRFQQIK